MERYGLIGKNIASSLSPVLFEAAYGGTLPYDIIEEEDFVSSYGRFLSSYKAINVTAPYKEDAFAQAVGLAKDSRGSISGPCYKIGATNLLVKTPSGIEAHNSDFTGIILTVAQCLFPDLVKICYDRFGERGYIKVHQYLRKYLQEVYPFAPQALVIGAGGAGRAAAVAAAEMGFSTAIMNRTKERADALAASLPEYGFLTVPAEDLHGALQECDLIIYTASGALQGMDSLTQEDFRSSAGGPGKIILEANYKTPSFDTALQEKMREVGCRYLDGLGWLRFQALTGYGIMTGRTPDIEALLSVPLK